MAGGGLGADTSHVLDKSCKLLTGVGEETIPESHVEGTGFRALDALRCRGLVSTRLVELWDGVVGGDVAITGSGRGGTGLLYSGNESDVGVILEPPFDSDLYEDFEFVSALPLAFDCF